MVAVREFVRLMRPKQWVKNLFVFAGIVFSGQLFSELLIPAILIFLAFSLASSTVYVINDIVDAPKDRKHKTKRRRPIAARKVSVAEAKVFACCLAFLCLLVITLVSLEARVLIVIYILFNILYTTLFKHLPVIDIFSIAFGFLLRIFAGTIGLSIPVSVWLLTTVLSLSLFLGFAKRYAEFSQKASRPVLKKYSKEYLQTTITLSAGLSIIFYALYIIETNRTPVMISTIPLVFFGFFRYLFITQTQEGGSDPTEELFHDPQIVLAAIGWSVLIIFGVVL